MRECISPDRLNSLIEDAILGSWVGAAPEGVIHLVADEETEPPVPIEAPELQPIIVTAPKSTGEPLESRIERKRKRLKHSGCTQIPGWRVIRKNILERDEHRCRVCMEGQRVRGLHVHHINYDRSDNSPANLVTLCGACHRAVHLERYKPANNPGWPVPWNIKPANCP